MSRAIGFVLDPFAVLDGGLSTALEELGEHPTGMLWTAAALVDRPEVITAAHRLAVEAGADLVISASYQASEAGFLAAGCSASEARQLLASTTAVARASGASIVAASVGPFGACLGDGSEYHGRYEASWADVERFHRRRLEVLVDTGPDLFAIETMPTRAEAELVVQLLRSFTAVPAWVSFTCVDGDHTAGLDRFADATAAVASEVQFVGVNCTAPNFVESLLRSTRVDLPLVVYPNHGAAWDAKHRCWLGHTGGLDLPQYLPAWLAAGAQLIGGCCGVGSDAVRALAALRGAPSVGS